MKRVFCLVMMAAMVLVLAACGGDISKVTVEEWEPSALYTDQEIESAINVTEKYFRKEFSGCTLTMITYAGDDVSKDYQDWADRHGEEEVIVLYSAFDVDSSGGDGSLNPNSTYNHWSWILVRSGGGKWKHVDHGY